MTATSPTYLISFARFERSPSGATPGPKDSEYLLVPLPKTLVRETIGHTKRMLEEDSKDFEVVSLELERKPLGWVLYHSSPNIPFATAITDPEKYLKGASHKFNIERANLVINPDSYILQAHTAGGGHVISHPFGLSAMGTAAVLLASSGDEELVRETVRILSQHDPAPLLSMFRLLTIAPEEFSSDERIQFILSSLGQAEIQALLKSPDRDLRRLTIEFMPLIKNAGEKAEKTKSSRPRS